MAPGNSSSRVVRTWTPRDYPTGDYAVQDTEGRVWHVHGLGAMPEVKTGEVRGVLSGDCIKVTGR